MKILVVEIISLLFGAVLLQGQTLEKPAESQPAEVVATAESHAEESAAAPSLDTQQGVGTEVNSAAVDANQDEVEKIVFIKRETTPESPKPNIQPPKEGGGCPGGVGSPCALLGGFRYYADQWKTDQHQRTWWDAFKTPGMLFSVSTLVGTTILDIEGSQACINAGTCKELNPLMGQQPKARKYAVAMPMSALLIWAAVHEKQHGHGLSSTLFMWTVSCTHLYFGVQGFELAKKH